MKNKNILIIIILISIVSIFIIKNNIFKENIKFNTLSLNIKNSDIKVESNLNKDILTIKVIATGDNELIGYNLNWNITNSLYDNINYKIYKSNELIKSKSKIEKLKSLNEGKINKEEKEQTVNLLEEEYINSSVTSKTNYYYLILDYNNKNKEGEFKSNIKLEENNKTPKINILAAYIENEEGTYKKIENGDIPQTGYTIDAEKSICSNNAIPSWNKETEQLIIDNLTKTGTACYLYYKVIPSEKTLADLGIDTSTLSTLNESEFNKIVCEPNTNNETHTDGDCDSSESGLYSGEDDFGTTYYYRGTVNNNWVKFANKWWRIIRINGNGSIRLIYSGSNKPTDGRWADKIDSQININTFNEIAKSNKYVGYMYGDTSGNYTDAHTNTNPSTIKTAIENWYSTNLTAYTDQLDGSVGFCNDRTPYQYSGVSATSKPDKTKYGFGTTQTYYGPYIRTVKKHIPTFNCTQSANDLFTMDGDKQGVGNGRLTYPVGLITADEVEFAGGTNANNYGYWLYTGAEYWTMSPHSFNGGYASVSCVYGDGHLYGDNVSDTDIGVRPVINLKANTKFTTDGDGTSGEKGTSTNPYVVQLD